MTPLRFVRLRLVRLLFLLGALLPAPALAQSDDATPTPAPGAPAPVPAPAPAPAPAAVPGPAEVGTAECAWIGQRILMLLWRDDIDTANDFFTVYDRFGCPRGHAGPAFRCLVQLGANPEEADTSLPDRVRACWENPALDPATYVPPEQVAPQVE